MNPEKTFFNYTVKDTHDADFNLDQYQGKVIFVVNVASHCGFTRQYTGLEALYQKHKDQGLIILAFPCNQFGKQEPGSDEEIQNFCSSNYHITFPVFAKIDVNGKNTAPVYEFLKKNARGFLGTKSIKWNFTKFLIGKDGEVLKRYAPTIKPNELEKDIESALKKSMS